MNHTITACRSCGHEQLEPVLDLGAMPHSDGLLTPAQLAEEEPRYPLNVVFCPHCSLMQITETVDPEILFGRDYPYFSSFADTMVAHARDNARELIATRKLGSNSLVVEIASNDGYLLRNFVAAGIPALGIDPAEGPAKAAQASGVPTLQAFFGAELAARLADEGGRADVIIGNNVLAHVADTNGFVAGLARLLKDDGIAAIEMPYVKNLVDLCQFDTIYHEHLCYFSLTALDHLFSRHGLTIQDVRRLPIHGGSLRIYAGRGGVRGQAVQAMLAEEAAAGLTCIDYYRDFAARVDSLREEVVALLSRLKRQGARIWGYGAAAKGTILLNAFRIGTDLLDCVVDRNTNKQGLFVPGVRLPILPIERLAESRPDFALLLPWNLAGEVLGQQRAYREAGGRFIIPIPQPKVV